MRGSDAGSAPYVPVCNGDGERRKIPGGRICGHHETGDIAPRAAMRTRSLRQCAPIHLFKSKYRLRCQNDLSQPNRLN